MIFFKGIPPAWKESSEKKGLKFAAFDFFPFTNNGGDHFANVGRVVQESIQHFFLWDFLCKQMNIYVELRIIWDKAKFIRGNMKNQNGHKWSGFWKLLKHSRAKHVLQMSEQWNKDKVRGQDQNEDLETLPNLTIL